jgi:hypothetical protein
VEDVLVDTRGCIYMTNGAEGGIWIVSYTGAAKNQQTRARMRFADERAR